MSSPEHAAHSQYILPHTDVIDQRIGEQMVLLHLGTNQFYELSSTAARFWELVREGHSLVEILHQMLLEFDVDQTTLESEIQSTLALLQEQNLISIQK